MVTPSGCDDGDDLALPAVDLDRFEPAVREQLASLRTRIDEDPRDAGAAGRYGMALDGYGWIEEAAVCYRRAVALDPAEFRWWYYLGRVESRSGRTAAALGALGKAVELRPSFVPAILRLGEISLEQGDAEGAARWFERARSASPDSTFAHTGLGQAALARGDAAEAARHFRSALDLEPAHAPAIYGLATARRALGDIASASELLERHATANRALTPPDPLLAEIDAQRVDADRLLEIANGHFERQRHDLALPLYRRVRELNPALAMVDYNIALSLHRSGATRDAMRAYRDVLRRSPDHLDARNNLGICHLELGEIEDAVRSFRETLDVDPDYHRAHFNLALALTRRGDIDSAIEAFRRALARNPRSPEAHRNLALLLRDRGDDDGATRHLLEALRLAPADDASLRELIRGGRRGDRPVTAAMHRRAAALLERHDLHAAAVRALELGLERSADDWRTAVSLAWILATCPDNAVRRPRRALELVEPIANGVAAREPWALDTLAAALAAGGRYGDAASAARRALRLLDEGVDAPDGLRRRIELRLELYDAGTPFIAD